MRKTNVAALGAAALALALGAAAMGAQAPGPEGRGWKGPGMGRADGMARFLGLTDAQKAQVQKLMEGQRAAHEALREKLEANRTAMQQALESASPDPTAVGELAIEGHRLHEQGRALREAQEKTVRSLLTAEQQVKFDAMKALREEHMGPMGGGPPMGHRGMPPAGDDEPRP
jgi:Spy/CpxP family protein refolding chaperone